MLQRPRLQNDIVNGMKRFWHNNSLSIVLFAIFAGSIIGMSIAGWSASNNDAMEHGEAPQSYLSFVSSGEFVEGVFENWESEFLQMWALVMLTIWLRQKGSDESKPMRGKMPQDATSRLSLARAATWSQRSKAFGHALYSHSLGLTLLAIFVVSFVLHAAGGAAMYNEDAATHNQSERVTPITYMGTSQFWYESLQNWQSEFLAVGALILLSIKLRERGSPESKPVGTSYDNTTGS